MARASACILILLASLSFGQPPCCLVGVSDCAAAALDDVERGPGEFLCPHCGKHHPKPEMPTRKGMCNQPDLQGALFLGELPIAPAALAIGRKRRLCCIAFVAIDGLGQSTQHGT